MLCLGVVSAASNGVLWESISKDGKLLASCWMCKRRAMVFLFCVFPHAERAAPVCALSGGEPSHMFVCCVINIFFVSALYRPTQVPPFIRVTSH